MYLLFNKKLTNKYFSVCTTADGVRYPYVYVYTYMYFLNNMWVTIKNRVGHATNNKYYYILIFTIILFQTMRIATKIPVY